MPRSKEESHRTDKGYGLRRIVTLSRRITFTKEDIEVRPQVVYDRLYRAFHRKYLFEWYSRNHKRYSYAELLIEADVVKDDISVSGIWWSKTHGAREETASTFFKAAVQEIVEKIRGKTYRTWYIHVLGTVLWRHKKS